MSGRFPSAIRLLLKTWYARSGYETIEVPCTAIDQRVNFILQIVEYALTRQSS